MQANGKLGASGYERTYLPLRRVGEYALDSLTWLHIAYADSHFQAVLGLRKDGIVLPRSLFKPAKDDKLPDGFDRVWDAMSYPPKSDYKSLDTKLPLDPDSVEQVIAAGLEEELVTMTVEQDAYDRRKNKTDDVPQQQTVSNACVSVVWPSSPVLFMNDTGSGSSIGMCMSSLSHKGVMSNMMCIHRTARSVSIAHTPRRTR